MKRPLSRQVTPEGETTAEKHQWVEQVGYVMDDDGDVHPIFLSEKQAAKRKEATPGSSRRRTRRNSEAHGERNGPTSEEQRQ